ncbi:MAG: CDP-diacylglycerol--serine O-phosphatidyltransferase [Bacteroidales bacterium]|jgi:CDP-diacylglycerol--serine O-phosphatidyltransferase|nr:CDP-diacylglycerol--serine O-phosphatidyltransferase [Bacteroidales bacterium]
MSEKSFLKHIPNGITCLNLFSGCLSIVMALNGRLDMACYFIFAAAVFDFFDGFTARWLKAYSDIGKELDSLADVVSFGVAPAAIMSALLISSVTLQGFSTDMFSCGWMISMLGYIIAVFSALRLANFNIDTRQTDSFIGLPTPANALFICALSFTVQGDGWIASFTGNMYFLLAITVIFSYLLVAELPLFSLKFKTFGWKANQVRYVFLIFSILVLVFFHWAGLALVILIYILLSILVRIFSDKKQIIKNIK